MTEVVYKSILTCLWDHCVRSMLVSYPLLFCLASTMVASFEIKPYMFNLSDGLPRMNSLIAQTVLPTKPELPNDADFGISLARLTSLKSDWVDEKKYDWNQMQASLNSFKQFTVTIEGLTIHYVHEKSNTTAAKPLLLLHGWPSSIYEFSRVIKPLTQAAATSSNGVNVTASYDIVVPSLPGFAASSPPPTNWTVEDTARIFNALMVDVLGYKTYALHGTDWGSAVGYSAYSQFPGNVRAAQFTFLSFLPPSAQEIADAGIVLDSFGQFAQERFIQWSSTGNGYSVEQRTKPNTIGLALQDNPVGQLAWLAEKFDSVSDPNGEVTDSDIFTTVSLYFLSKTFLSSVYIYAQNLNAFKTTYTKAPTDAPMLFSNYKWNVGYWPKEFVTKVGNLVVYKEHYKGGHLPGLDNPEALIEDLREVYSYY
ncbi:Alpha/Beta hydrolase protein [Mycena floridula]|nr:Alpha/Beta hydrolase protein [Mycena floridula]